MKILVVDDHALIRDALRGVLKKLNAGCGRIGGFKLRSNDGGRREPSGY